MTKLNYFKPIDELSEDFKKLSLHDQQKETTILLDNYLKNSREDFDLIGRNTAQTENVWNMYDHLQSIITERIEKL